MRTDNVLSPSVIAEMSKIDWWHHIPLGIDVDGNVVMTHGMQGGIVDSAGNYLGRYAMPSNLTGLSVLDIGAWDGLFSFEAEKRGAKRVVAIDFPHRLGLNWKEPRGFEFAHRILESTVEFHWIDVYDLSPDAIGTFDVVLLYGVLYHLRDPLRALDAIASVANPGGSLIVETAFSDSIPPATPAWSFEPGKFGDQTNSWYPSEAGLTIACAYSGFVHAKHEAIDSDRLTMSFIHRPELRHYRNFGGDWPENFTGRRG